MHDDSPSLPAMYSPDFVKAVWRKRRAAAARAEAEKMAGPGIAGIVASVAAERGVSPADITGRAMDKPSIVARQEAMRRVRAAFPDMHAATIGQAFGRTMRAVHMMLDEVPREPQRNRRPKNGASVKCIVKWAAARHHGVSAEDIVGPVQKYDVVAARHEAMAEVAKRRPDLSLRQIGEAFGGRDHATVIHALRKHGIQRAAA